MKERINYYSDGLKLSEYFLSLTMQERSNLAGVVLVPGFMSTADAFFPGFATSLPQQALCP